jgi:hypothetical protein
MDKKVILSLCRFATPKLYKKEPSAISWGRFQPKLLLHARPSAQRSMAPTGELYDGHIAQGTWNITSTQPLQNSDEGEKFKTIEVEDEDTNEPQVDARIEQDEDIVIVERVEQRLPKRSGAPTVNQEKETKRMRKDALEGLIGRYLDVKTKQVADEAAQSTKEKEVAQDNDFSIKRCISVLKTMDITRDEKIKAAEVFSTPNYRETFICFNDDEPEVVLLWLRGKMDKL